LESSHEIESIYTFDPKRGEVRSKLTGWRILMLSSDSWVSLVDGLYSKFADKASLIILQMGFSYGSNLAMRLGVLDPATERTFQVDATLLVEIMTKAGWGLVSFTADQYSGTQASIIVKNCVFCKEKDSYPCDFLRGVILGLSTKMYDQHYISSTSCTVDSAGKHICHINMTST
jgi:hypothetical protein